MVRIIKISQCRLNAAAERIIAKIQLPFFRYIYKIETIYSPENSMFHDPRCHF